MKPMRPVPRGCAAGFFDGRYKVEAEDFLVEEIPAYEPSGDGAHAWLWIEKREIASLELLKRLGRMLRRHEKSFGIAGLKDSKSISRQWVSCDIDDEQALASLGDDNFRVLRVSRHNNKLRLGHLRGNRFTIVLRGTGDGDLERAQQNLAELMRVGVPNYFGEQRFGKRGANLQKGLEILRGDAAAMARRIPRRVFGLMLSAVQSEVFNRVVAQRLETLGTVLAGDLCVLHRNGAVFTVDDPQKEQPRADAMEVSPSGPMPGPKMMQPSGDVLRIEQEAMAALELDEHAFDDMPFGLAQGERRPLRMPVSNARADAHDEGLKVAFTLPKGGYATAVLRELLTDTVWFADDAANRRRHPFRRR